MERDKHDEFRLRLFLNHYLTPMPAGSYEAMGMDMEKYRQLRREKTITLTQDFQRDLEIAHGTGDLPEVVRDHLFKVAMEVGETCHGVNTIYKLMADTALLCLEFPLRP